MSVQKLFNGQNVVLSLVFLLLYLIYSSLQSPDSTLSKILAPNVTPTPTPVILAEEEDVIEEHEPEVASSGGKVEGTATERMLAQVVKVVDGDTVTVSISGKEETIRVIGLNTPETVDPRRGVQCFGKEASNFAKQLLTGKTVYLEPDPSQSERDRYGRLLRFVFLQDGKDFGEIMIREGYGNEYTYDNPYKYQLQYKQAEQEARANKKGFWADGTC